MLCSLYLFLCPIYCIYYTTNESPVIVFFLVEFNWYLFVLINTEYYTLAEFASDSHSDEALRLCALDLCKTITIE